MTVMKKPRTQVKFELKGITKESMEGQCVHIVVNVLCNDVCNVEFVCASIY